MIFKSYFFIKISPNVYTPRPLSNYIVDSDKFDIYSHKICSFLYHCYNTNDDIYSCKNDNAASVVLVSYKNLDSTLERE